MAQGSNCKAEEQAGVLMTLGELGQRMARIEVTLIERHSQVEADKIRDKEDRDKLTAKIDGIVVAVAGLRKDIEQGKFLVHLGKVLFLAAGASAGWFLRHVFP